MDSEVLERMNSFRQNSYYLDIKSIKITTTNNIFIKDLNGRLDSQPTRLNVHKNLIIIHFLKLSNYGSDHVKFKQYYALSEKQLSD